MGLALKRWFSSKEQPAADEPLLNARDAFSQHTVPHLNALATACAAIYSVHSDVTEEYIGQLLHDLGVTGLSGGSLTEPEEFGRLKTAMLDYGDLTLRTNQATDLVRLASAAELQALTDENARAFNMLAKSGQQLASANQLISELKLKVEILENEIDVLGNDKAELSASVRHLEANLEQASKKAEFDEAIEAANNAMETLPGSSYILKQQDEFQMSYSSKWVGKSVDQFLSEMLSKRAAECEATEMFQQWCSHRSKEQINALRIVFSRSLVNFQLDILPCIAYVAGKNPDFSLKRAFLENSVPSDAKHLRVRRGMLSTLVQMMPGPNPRRSANNGDVLSKLSLIVADLETKSDEELHAITPTELAQSYSLSATTLERYFYMLMIYTDSTYGDCIL